MKVLNIIIFLCVCCLNAHAQKYWVMGQIVDDFTYPNFNVKIFFQ